MKRTVLAGAAMLLAATTAQAGRTNLINSGLWAVDLNSNDGKPMCSMTATKVWPNGAVGAAQFKWEAGSLFTHVTKSNWRISAGTQIPMSISFDTGARAGTGTVIEDQHGGSTIQTNVADDEAAGFMADFANAKMLTFSFDSGTEQPWVTTMTGSRKAAAVFNGCISLVKANAPTHPGAQSSSQPAAPTQPVKPQSTQPAGKDRVKDDGGI
jgi:hypothetical protein